MIIAHKCKVPTRSQISVVHRMPHYSPRLVFSLGIVQSVSGIALIFLSLVLLRLDRERTFAWSISIHYLDNVIPDILRIVWLGLWVLITGLITLMVSCRPYSNCQVYVLLISSLMTIAITGTFSIVSHHLCSCSLFNDKFSTDYHIYDTTVWSRKERIVQWVMQQSAINTSTATATTTTSTNTAVNDQTTLSLHRPELILTDTGSYLDLLHLHSDRKRLSLAALHSNNTNSTYGTNLSLYGT
ncbi:hypothetical protein BLOT_016271 [Blomia tropicalis]|nr:hypothetical protein BLOT_016271 [Blomia tropicalis]